MRPDHRDGLINRCLAIYEANRQLAQWDLIKAFCGGLGGKNMTDAHLDAVLTAILDRLAIWEPPEMAVALLALCRALRGRNISPAHRDILVTRVRESSRLPDIVASLKFTSEGQELVAVLQLEQLA